jgi:hypothetical protein
MQVRIE